MEEIPRILIIDDDMVDRLVIARALRKSGGPVRISEASNIETALRRIEEEPWDCVFLDYLLPGGDGLNLLKEIRAKGNDMPIVVVTSQGDEKVAVEVMKAGGSDYLTKDLISAESVNSVLRHALRAHRAESERRRTALALADSEARLTEAQRIANIGSWEIEIPSLEEFWTEQVFAILGEPVQGNKKMGRRTLKHNLMPEGVELCQRAFSEIIELQVPRSVDVRLKTQDGRIRMVELQGKPVFAPDGSLLKVIGTIQDITIRKEIEDALREAMLQAEQNAKAKQEFLANMSHEIRTPMNAILGFAKLLQDTALNSEQQEFVAAIDSSGEALLAILNDILDLSKIEAGMMRFEQHPFSLQSAFQAIQVILGAKAKEKQIHLETFIGPGVPNWVVGDFAKLRQVLLNLVSNAIKFTERGEVIVEAKLLEEDQQEATILFEVSDTGIGVPLEKQASIFDSFTQGSSDTTRRFGGTGLGLTICKRIVDQQGGRIGLDSTPGEGSNFYFQLKFPIAPEQSCNEAKAKEVPAIKDNTLPHLRVLLAEDNKLNQRLAALVLQKMGLTTILAQTGREAVDLVVSERPDLVLMDIQMPEMDGYTATVQIRNLEDPILRDIPIIALTAHALRTERDRCLQAGMNSFITKPFQQEQLRAQLLGIFGNKDTPAPMAPLPAIDLSGLETFVGSDPKLKMELIEIFISEVPKALEKMKSAIEADLPRELYKAAHTVKPSLIMFGLKDGEALIHTLELAEKKAHISEMERQAFTKLQERAQEMCTALAIQSGQAVPKN